MNQPNKYAGGIMEVITEIAEIVSEDILIGNYEKATRFLKESIYEIAFNAYQRNLYVYHNLKNITESCSIPGIREKLEEGVEKQLNIIEKNKKGLLNLDNKVDKMISQLHTQLNNLEKENE